MEIAYDYLGLCVFFPGVFLSSRVTGACPVTTDLIMRVNVRTTTIGIECIRCFVIHYSSVSVIRYVVCTLPAIISYAVRVQLTRCALVRGALCDGNSDSGKG